MPRTRRLFIRFRRKIKNPMHNGIGTAYQPWYHPTSRKKLSFFAAHKFPCIGRTRPSLRAKVPFGPGRSGAMFRMGLSRRAHTLPRSLWAASMHTLSVIAPRFILSYFIDFMRLCQWVAAHWRTFIIIIYPSCTAQQKVTKAARAFVYASKLQNSAPLCIRFSLGAMYLWRVAGRFTNTTYSLFTITYYLKKPPRGISTGREVFLLIIRRPLRSKDKLSHPHWRA